MDQRLSAGHELQFERLRGDLQRAVALERLLLGIEPGSRPAVERRLAIGVGEDEILGDLAQRRVRGEQLDARLVRGRRPRQRRGVEQRGGKKLRDVARETRISNSADKPLAHDDMRPKIFHHDHRLGAIEVEQLGRQAGRVASLLGQRAIFEPRALERQRPRFADEPHIGQRLLDDDAVSLALDNEHQVEIAVADLADPPAGRLAAEPIADRGNIGKRAGKARAIHGSVGRHAAQPARSPLRAVRSRSA